MASIQAARAQDKEVAHALTLIADDETRHAALSWDITPAERDAVRAARASALAELRHSLEHAPSLGAQRVAGMPDPSTAIRALDSLSVMVEGLLVAA